MRKDWVLNEEYASEKSLIKRLLYSRGIKSEEEIREFLNPLEMELTSPEVFTDMKRVTERISAAIENKEHIVIYGDFDADGVTSTSILYKTLKTLGAEVSYYIPNREFESHGLNTKALIELMKTVKPKLLITVDCGISDIEPVKFINSFRVMDVIITDHHEAPEELPPAYAIINPKAQNSLSEDLTSKQIEHLTYLAGCGVAFKVAQSLLIKHKRTDFIDELLPFVAVGTIADIVPLLGENRNFVVKGLSLISKGKHKGLAELLKSAGYDIANGVTSEQIAFGVAPRINAAGRLDTVDHALKILLSDNFAEIQMAIETINELNKVRQRLCDDIFAQADKMVNPKEPAIILYNEEWHIGIIGIVASKLVEKYYKPVFLMNYSKNENVFRCSARSIAGVPLYEVLRENEKLFSNYGGHTMAAGLGFNGDEKDFENVKKALNETIQSYIGEKELKPFIKVDMKLEPSDITFDFIENLSQLEPFGASNPNPLFEMDGLKILQRKTMGSNNNHLRLTVEKDGQNFTSVWWGNADSTLSMGDSLDIVFYPQINEYNGETSIQLFLEDVHSDSIKEEEPQDLKYRIYDNRSKTNILPLVNDYLKNTKNNVKVFAESKYILDTIKPFGNIYSKIFTREDISACDVVMFFDYPSDEVTLDNILEKTGAKVLHFMNYEIKTYDEAEFLKVFTGMIKFAIHNNSGRVEKIRCLSFLGVSEIVIDELMKLYEEFGVIKIDEQVPSYYVVSDFNPDNVSEIINSEKYLKIYDEIQECNLFQKSLTEDDLTQVLCYN